MIAEVGARAAATSIMQLAVSGLEGFAIDM